MPPRKSPRKRQQLSQELIVAEAMTLADEEGVDALSFRALGRRLGCEAMSLYHYFPSKQHLIDALVSTCLAETPIPEPGASPRDRMAELARRYRATILRHPGFSPMLVTHRLNHREGLAWLDQVVGLLESDRVGYDRKAVLFRVLSYYLTGAGIDEAMGYRKGSGAAEPVPMETAAKEFPEIMGIGAHFGDENHEAFFEKGLEVILDWIDSEL